MRYLREDDHQKTLKLLIAYHNIKMDSVLKLGTMKNYYTKEKYLNGFLSEKMKTKNIYLKQLNYRFITDFEHYLRNYRNTKEQLMLTNNDVMKHLEHLKKRINLSIKLKWIIKNPF